MRLLQSLVNETRQSISRGEIKSVISGTYSEHFLINYLIFLYVGNQRLNILKDVNSQLTLRVPRHEDRIEKLHRYVNGLKVKQEKQKEAVDRKREQLKKVIRTAAKQLIQYIFPLSKVQPNRRY